VRTLFAFLLWAAASAAAGQSACPARLFVSGFFSTVHVYDACTGAYLRNLDPSNRIHGAQAVVLGGDGLLYVVSESTSQILRYRNDTLDFVDVFATLPGASPTGVAIAPDGSVYVGGFATNDVRRFNADGSAAGRHRSARGAGLVGPDNGMLFAPDGNLYVPGYNSNSVVRYDPRSGAASVAVASQTAGLFRTRGLRPIKDGSGLFITGEQSGQVLRFDFASGAVTAIARMNTPTGIDYAPDGDLLVASLDTSVTRLDPATGAQKGLFVRASADGANGVTYIAVIAASAPVRKAVVEFYNAALDHYFISALDADIEALDSGRLKGWQRTGLTFDGYLSPAPGTSPVCRFYLPPGSGDSHFYSASPAECSEVMTKFPQFLYEAADVFHIALPDTATGARPGGTKPVYRLWNNRADSNHRYTSDLAVKAQMIARGYVAEGYGADAVIMCAPV
jgi:streptogramin lyase